MRVISGSAKSLHLKAPKTHKVRPALDKVKGAIFNILGDINELKVLDLFGGTGSVGIEALSRGAHSCVFIEADRQIAAYIHENLRHCQLESHSDVWIAKVERAIPLLHKKQQKFDLIFIDPPYHRGLVNRTLETLQQFPLFEENCRLIIEHGAKEPPVEQETLEIYDQRQYGQTFLSFLKRKIL